MNAIKNIRNFAVISHIDHGKTTLTDRFLEISGLIAKDKLHNRHLDSNPIEKERGITIKLAPVRMSYRLGANVYVLNLIDTPGHVDFSYEVSRSLAACEGAVLLIDATQGIQAQTVANTDQALKNNLQIVPVINKIDSADAEPKKVAQQLENTFGFNQKEIIYISAKNGTHLLQLIKEIIDKIPSPQTQEKSPLKALIFNSFYHQHKGIVVYVRIFDGQVELGQTVLLMAKQTPFIVKELGYFTPDMQPAKQLSAGEVGYLATGLKKTSFCQVGDTITNYPQPNLVKSLAGYQEPKPMVFVDLYPVNNEDFSHLKISLEKLQLMDFSLQFSVVNSEVLGSGFKIGFQGLLHADIVQERLEREFNLDLIATSPLVEYQVELKKSQQTISILNPNHLPASDLINKVKEPYIKIAIFTPKKYLGRILKLCQNSRGDFQNQQFYGDQVRLDYHLPLTELIGGFFNQLKSVSSGFASLDWQFLEFRVADIVKLSVLINHQEVDPLATLVTRRQSQSIAHYLALKLKQLIPKQQFEIPIQVTVGNKVLARQTIKAFRKDVTAKLYGGDQTRKDKLLEKQKKGKKRLKQIGKVIIPQEAFLAMLSPLDTR